MWLLVSLDRLPLSLQPYRTQLIGTPPLVHSLLPAWQLNIWTGVEVARRTWTGLLHLFIFASPTATLAGDNPVHPADAPAALSRPKLHHSLKKAAADTMGFPQLVAGGAWAACVFFTQSRHLSLVLAYKSPADISSSASNHSDSGWLHNQKHSFLQFGHSLFPWSHRAGYPG